MSEKKTDKSIHLVPVPESLGGDEEENQRIKRRLGLGIDNYATREEARSIFQFRKFSAPVPIIKDGEVIGIYLHKGKRRRFRDRYCDLCNKQLETSPKITDHSDPSMPLYFCSEECADSWRLDEEIGI